MSPGWTIFGMAAITFACRVLPMLAMTDLDRLPGWLRRWMDYVPPAILAATVAPSVIAPAGEVAWRPDWLAFAACLAVAVRTRKLLPPLLTGLVVLIVLTSLHATAA